jgi:hypothetical protein
MCTPSVCSVAMQNVVPCLMRENRVSLKPFPGLGTLYRLSFFVTMLQGPEWMDTRLGILFASPSGENIVLALAYTYPDDVLDVPALTSDHLAGV